MSGPPGSRRAVNALTSAGEDYLKAIFELGGESVKTVELAAALDISPASVTGMLRKLAELRLVEYERYRGASLTTAGRKVALETIRHHRLLETYLAEALGYQWFEVHDEAEKLEHHISEEFEDRIAEALGHPSHDPHGDPIPDRDGTVPEVAGRALGEHPVDGDVELTVTRIVRLPRGDLEELDRLGLQPGAIVRVLTRGADGTVGIACGGREFALSAELAAGIIAETRT